MVSTFIKKVDIQKQLDQLLKTAGLIVAADVGVETVCLMQ